MQHYNCTTRHLNCKLTNYILIQMLFRKIIIPALLIFSAHFSIFSQKNPQGKALYGAALSSKVESTLAKSGFSPIPHYLSKTGQDSFAYNILLDFGGEAEHETVFCFMQEDYFDHEEEILDFLNYLKNQERLWNATVLFSALDKFPFKTGQAIKGTEVFATSIDNTDSCSAIAISFSKEEGTSIYTGGKKNTTPLWLTRQVSNAFFDSKISFSFENKLSSIYRLGIVKGQERLSYFLENRIPAIGINFSEPQEISFLKKFAENFTTQGTDEWDIHYLYINRGGFFRPLFIGERTIILSCLSVGILTILLLCVFSFIGENGEKHKYEFIKTSYMIPFTIGLSFISLVLGQHVVTFLSSIFSINPIILYGIKIVFSMIFISALFMVQGILKISVTAFMYGYLLLVVAIFNIFLFSSRDLTLFVIFVAEYILIYLSRNAKSLFSLSIYFILMMLPFLPYGFIIIRRAEDIELTKTVFTTAGGNLLLSMAIFPFQITWLRMLVFLNVRAGIKGYTMKKTILNGIFSTITILFFISMVIFLISHFVYRPDFRSRQNTETKFFREEKFTMSAKLSSDEFLGMKTNHIKIISEEDALRYEILLKGKKASHPIYDSIYNYTIASDSEGNDTYTFIIPDYPPKQVTIDYAAPVKTNAVIEVTAFYKTDKADSIRIEKRELKAE